jgi:hypothetical protein
MAAARKWRTLLWRRAWVCFVYSHIFFHIRYLSGRLVAEKSALKDVTKESIRTTVLEVSLWWVLLERILPLLFQATARRTTGKQKAPSLGGA